MIPPCDTTCFTGGLSHLSLGLSPSPRGSVPREEALLHHSQCGLTDFFGTPCISVHERLPRAEVSRGSDAAHPGRGVRDLPVRDLRDWLRKDHVT